MAWNWPTLSPSDERELVERLNARMKQLERELARQQTGWAAPTGTADRTTFVTSTVTLEELAERVKALIDDLTELDILGA